MKPRVQVFTFVAVLLGFLIQVGCAGHRTVDSTTADSTSDDQDVWLASIEYDTMLQDVERLEAALLGFRRTSGRWPVRLSELIENLDREGNGLEFESIRQVGLLPGGDGELVARIEHAVSPVGSPEPLVIRSRLVMQRSGESLWSFESELGGISS